MAERRRLLVAVTDPQSIRLLDGVPARLTADGWDVHLVVGAAAPQVAGATVHVVPMTRNPAPLADLLSLVRWVRTVRRLRPDVVLVGTPKAGLLGSLAARLCRVPTRIYHLRGLRLETADGVLRQALALLERLAMSGATRVLSVSHSLASECVQLGLAPPDKFTVLGAGSSNGVDIEHFSPPTPEQRRVAREQFGWSMGPPVVGYVGRMTPEKGLDDLVEAAARACGTTSMRVLLVGSEEEPGYAAVLTSRLEAAGIEAVHVAGVTDPAPLYHAMDVFCLPSRREGFPNVALEAAASGLPVVTTNATGCRDAVLPGSTGWVARVADPDDLAGCLVRALESETERTRLGLAGRRLVETAFERTAVQQMLVEFLAEGAHQDPEVSVVRATDPNRSGVGQ